MRLEVNKYLYDIQHAAALVVQFTAGKEFADYQQDPMLRMAVERALTIIGEALSQLAKLDSAIAAQFSEYQRIIAFRNVLIHAYAEVDDRIVWEVIERKLPALHQQAASLMDKIAESDP
jgi:uncharacterized protein with HEPN domain